MANRWTAEESALIERELRRPTMTNQELADKLGKSLQSIAAKKRHAAAVLEQEKQAQKTESKPAPAKPAAEKTEPVQPAPAKPIAEKQEPVQPTPAKPAAEKMVPVQPAPARPVLQANREWTPQEDAMLMATPYKSEDELSESLSRPKEEVHRRRVTLQKQRLEEKERAKRLLIETVTTPLRTDAPEERAPRAVSAAGQTAQLRAIRALISMLGQCAEATEIGAVQDFLAAAEFILGE